MKRSFAAAATRMSSSSSGILVASGETFGRAGVRLRSPGKLPLLFSVEEGDLTDLVQIQTNCVTHGRSCNQNYGDVIPSPLIGEPCHMAQLLAAHFSSLHTPDSLRLRASGREGLRRCRHLDRHLDVIGVFGGTFDPPHVGHLVAAVNVRHALDLDRVLLVVANVPWQKVGEREITPAEDRLAMVEAAAQGVAGIEASRIEIDRGGSSYTADTLAALRDQYDDPELFLIVGSDAAGGLTTWERVDEVRDGCTVVVVDRPGAEGEQPPAGWRWLRVEVPRLEVSSTDLRARVTDGRPLDYLLPPGVIECIRSRGLYAVAVR